MLVGDFAAGCTMFVFQIPQGIAYGSLAAIPAKNGLYSSFYPAIIYAFFGTSRHVSIGLFAMTCIMTSKATSKLVNGFENNDYPEYDTVEKLQINGAITIAFFAGIIQLVLGLLKMGFLISYLPMSLIEGLNTAAAIEIISSQIPHVLGMVGVTENYKCPETIDIFCQYREFVRYLMKTPPNYYALGVSIFVIITYYIYKEFLSDRLTKLIHFNFPIELLYIGLSTLISYLIKADKPPFNLPIVGPISQGIDPPNLPDFKLFRVLFVDIVAISIVGLAITASLGKIFASKYGYSIDNNQELVALGTTNVVSSFFSCAIAASSLSRSSVVSSSGMHSQIAGLISSFFMFFVLMWLGFLFVSVPKCVLAGIIIISLKNMAMQFTKLKSILEHSVIDFMTWIVTFVCTLLFSITYGLAIGFVFALMTILFRTQKPKARMLARIRYTDIYVDKKIYSQAVDVPFVKIFQFNAPLYFANVDVFRTQLAYRTGLDAEKIKRLLAEVASQQAAVPASIAAMDNPGFSGDVEQNGHAGRSPASLDQLSSPTSNNVTSPNDSNLLVSRTSRLTDDVVPVRNIGIQVEEKLLELEAREDLLSKSRLSKLRSVRTASLSPNLLRLISTDSTRSLVPESSFRFNSEILNSDNNSLAGNAVTDFDASNDDIQQTDVEPAVLRQRPLRFASKFERRNSNINASLRQTFQSLQRSGTTGCHHIILDCSAWSYVDSMGIICLKEVIADYREINITVFLANVKYNVRRTFMANKMYNSEIRGRIFLTVHDAVLAALAEHQQIYELLTRENQTLK